MLRPISVIFTTVDVVNSSLVCSAFASEHSRAEEEEEEEEEQQQQRAKRSANAMMRHVCFLAAKKKTILLCPKQKELNKKHSFSLKSATFS